jgi:hypothetical protein
MPCGAVWIIWRRHYVSNDSRLQLEWHGDVVKAKLLKATAVAMDRVMADCVDSAKHLCPVKTTTLQRSIQMRPTKKEGKGLVGYWGSFNLKYAIYHELGTGMYGPAGRGYEIRPKHARALFWPGAQHPVMVVHHPGVHPRPFLRPSADAIYPGLPRCIREEYEA